MKKTLLLCLALSWLLTLDAQTFTQKLEAAKALSSRAINRGNGLEKLQTPELFRTNRSSRSLEDHIMDPKVMGNINASAAIYRATLSCNKAISLATYYDKELVERFKENKITAFYTVITSGATAATFWIKKDLNGENVWEYDVPSGFPTNQEIGIECDYVIDEGPLYVGYTLSIPSLASTATASIYFTPDIEKSQSMLIDTHNGRGFSDYSSEGALYLVCQTEGENGLKDCDVELSSVDYVNRTLTGNEYYLTGSLTNYGAYPVLSFNTKLTLDGVEKELEVETDTLDFMQTAHFQIPYQAPEKGGRYSGNFEITGVNNGADGNPDDNTATTALVVMDNAYKRKAVMEDFTGTEYGWCPHGIVAMEKLTKDYPDSFIGIDVHSGTNDLFAENTYTLASIITSRPLGLVNRYYFVDPYYGVGETSYGITEVIEAINNSPSEAVVGLSSTLSADSKNIEVTSYPKFGYNASTCPYLISYVLLEDSLQAEQANYYSNLYASQTGYTQLNLPQDLKFLFAEGRSYVANFNHVARGIYDCFGIEGSLSGSISSNEIKTHTYTIPVPETISNLANLSVVAMLIDSESGEIVTAEKVKAGEAALTGIGTVNRNHTGTDISVSNGTICVSAQNATASVYTTNGQLISSTKVNGKVTLPAIGLKGIYIVRIDNGNDVVVKKVKL